MPEFRYTRSASAHTIPLVRVPTIPTSRATTITNLRAFLEGAWRVLRTLEDRRAGIHGSFLGRGSFDPDSDGLRYTEDGVLRLAAHEGTATRRYRYRFPAPHRADVAFEDGRPFHAIDLRRGSWAVTHACGKDTYRTTFRVLGREEWSARWHIAGPRKDHLVVSHYRRESSVL